ncbi:MAG: hypothetical protein J5843_00755 [Clostridia bacterium]|nr:hypothetical protein [Clostridia bacterium]
MSVNRFLYLILAAALGLTFALTGCQTGGETSKDGEKAGSDLPAEPSETVAQEQGDPSTIYSFTSVSQMKKTVPSEKRASVLLKGYARANDGGGGMFYWDAESVLEPDGGVVIEAQDSAKGRYIRVCEDDYRNVKWFGASGDGNRDDTSPIRSAVASLPATGGTVCFPGGIYLITDTIEIGNGDGSGTGSDCNGIRLTGNGGGFGVHSEKEPTVIQAERKMGAMISVNGKIAGVELTGLCLSAASKAQVCIAAKAVNGLVLENVVCKMFTECGIRLAAGTGDGNGCADCRFETVSAVSLTDNIICVDIGGEAGACVTENCVFTDCRFDIHSTLGSTACRIRNAKGLTFYRSHITGYTESGSDYLVLDASADGYPSENVFYDCSVASVTVLEEDGHSIGHHFFYGHGTYDMETVPDHPMLHGITDSGLAFRFGGGAS